MADIWSGKALKMLIDLMTTKQYSVYIRASDGMATNNARCRLASYILTYGCVPEETA